MTLEDEAGDVLRKARLGRGISLEEASRASTLSPSLITAAEKLEGPVSRDFLPLARILGLDGEALLAMVLEEGVDASLPESTRRLKTPWGSWTYVFLGRDGAIVIDPAVPVAACRKAAGGSPLRDVLVTHGHPDHVATLDMFRDLPRYAHPALSAALGTSPFPEEGIWGFRAIEAPGHAREGLAFAGHGLVFTGDALFARSAGGAPGPDAYPDVLATVRRLLTLPPDTAVLPGHGGSSTIGLERRLNPFRGDGQ